MKIYLSILFALVFYSCSPKQNNGDNKILLEKIEGEWTIPALWTDSILTLEKISASNKQKIFPCYNTVIFNQKSKKIDVNTYGEFGCGLAAIENLNMDVYWSFKDEQLCLSGKYSDFSGRHTINCKYIVERKVDTLILKKIN